MPAYRLLLICSLVLTACAGPGRHEQQRPAHNARAEALRDGAYRPQREDALSVSMQNWIVGGDTLPVSLAFPAGSERGLPLIVYLPGLGESAQGGAALRHAWARAGYAVLSVQPLAADERAWSSDLARAADFRALARERRKADQRDARVQKLQSVLDEVRRRAAAGDALWQRVDFSRLGLAGFELGTQAALAVPEARARLVIGPLASEGAGPAPLLVIASRRDSDPLTGEPMAPQARELIDASPAGELLMFDKAPHAALSGNATAQDAEVPQDRAEQRGSRGGGGEGGGRKGGGGRGRPGGGPQMSGGNGASPMGGGATRPGMASAEGETTAIAIVATSTAFWDATLRMSPLARAWLQRDAMPWLRGLADYSPGRPG